LSEIEAHENPSSRPGDDPGAQEAEALDLQLHHIAGLEPAAGILRTEFEDAAPTHRARAEQIAGKKLGVARGLRDEPRIGW